MLGTYENQIGLCVDGRGGQYLASPGDDSDETGNFELNLNFICGNFERSFH